MNRGLKLGGKLCGGRMGGGCEEWGGGERDVCRI